MENETLKPAAILSPPWRLVTRFWWAFFWRFAVIVCVLQVIVAWIVVTYAPKISGDEGSFASWIIIIGTACSVSVLIVGSLVSMKMVLGKKFKGFRLSIESRKYRYLELSESSSSLIQTLNRTVKRPFTRLNGEEIDQLLVGFAALGKQDGILVLDATIPYIKDEFLKLAIQLLTDGTEPESMRGILEGRVDSLSPQQGIKYQKVIEGVVAIQEGAGPQAITQRVRSIC